MLRSLATGIIALIGLLGAAQAQEAKSGADRQASKASESHSEQGSPGYAASLMKLCHIDVKGDLKDEWRRLPQAQSSVTQHHFSAGGKSFDYTATAGTLIVREDDDKSVASIGYVAYTRRAAKQGEERPLMFAFNGGPGSSSLRSAFRVLPPYGLHSSSDHVVF